MVKSSHIWCNIQGLENQESKLIEEIKPEFNKYYTIKYENYGVSDHYIQPESCIPVNYGGE